MKRTRNPKTTQRDAPISHWDPTPQPAPPYTRLKDGAERMDRPKIPPEAVAIRLMHAELESSVWTYEQVRELLIKAVKLERSPPDAQ